MKYSSTNQSIVYLLAVAFLFVTIAADDVFEGERKLIVGGNDADPGEYPYYALLDSGCGGALISPNQVLSAAHCGYPSYINVGVTYRDTLDNGRGVKDGKRIMVCGKTRHPSYDPLTHDYDYAIYTLCEPYEIDSAVKLRIHDSTSYLAVGLVFTAIGLGTTSQGGSFATTLQEVDLIVFPQQQCISFANDIDRMFCVGALDGEGGSTCHGDSGGPIVKKDGNTHYLMGVSSYSYGCGQYNSYGVYAGAFFAHSWIKDNGCYNSYGHAVSGICITNNSEWKYQNKRGKDCDWVAANDNRRNKLCKKNPVKNNCPLVCEEC